MWHFAERSDQLFKSYTNMFLKTKQETSDWPHGCNTHEERQADIDDYLQHEVIRLDPDKIEDNPGLRKVTKLNLNNFWGKFGQQENQTRVTTCIKPSDFVTMLQDDRQLIHRLEIVNEGVIHIYHSYDHPSIPIQTNVNVFMAAFTTCYA